MPKRRTTRDLLAQLVVADPSKPSRAWVTKAYLTRQPKPQSSYSKALKHSEASNTRSRTVKPLSPLSPVSPNPKEASSGLGLLEVDQVRLLCAQSLRQLCGLNEPKAGGCLVTMERTTVVANMCGNPRCPTCKLVRSRRYLVLLARSTSPSSSSAGRLSSSCSSSCVKRKRMACSLFGALSFND